MPIDRTLLQDIATRGRAALDDYRNSRQMNGSAAQQALQSRSQTYQAMSGQQPQQMPTSGRGSVYDNLIFARNSQRFPAPGARGIIYGQVPDEKGKMGKYAGFEVASDLWNAIEGEANNIRGQDQDEAGALRQIASEQYDQLGSDYDQSLAAAIAQTGEQRDAEQAMHSLAGQSATGATSMSLTQPNSGNPNLATPTGRGDHLTYMQQPQAPQTGYENVPGASPIQLTPPPQTRGSRGFVQGDQIGGPQPQGPVDPKADLARQYAAMHSDDKYAAGQHNYQAQLNDWLGGQVDPLQQMEGYAQDISETPYSQYAQAAGAEYGVDPNIVGGRFGPAEDYRDYGLQRNLSSIQDYGLPYNEVEAQLKASDAAGLDQQKQADQAGEQAVADQITEITGTDAKQLAASANMTTMQLAQAVSDPEYQQADAELRQAVTDGDDQGFSSKLQEIAQQRPDLYEVLVKALADFVPSGYDLYGG